MLRSSELKGMRVPGLSRPSEEEERLITTLFADDTTTYLGQYDSFEDLEGILAKWCKASRARFNISKTETIPVGSQEYRERLLETREMYPGGPKIPDGIRIAEDGRAIRILGGWVGNETNNAAPWTKILEDIDERLRYWEKTHPTMEGRRLIILMVVGGKTQYLAKVQGMPVDVEKLLEKRINQFLWGEKRPTVNAETTKAPILEEGKNVLDIPARNEAISLMWLKSYLDFGDNRATWAYFADAIIAKHASCNELKGERNDEIKMNIFLQSWKATNLVGDLGKMVKAAKDLGVRLQGLAFSRETMEQMPIWLH
ncbi:hypothetical protein C8J56DRAFT_801088, partial [Mycena floridula]